MLDASHFKQQLHATNLANIETPGFKRWKVSDNFSEQLRNFAQDGSGKKAQRADRVLGLKNSSKRDYDSKPVRIDGNNVELDKELLEVNRNSMHYQFLTQMTSSSIKHLNLAIKGRA